MNLFAKAEGENLKRAQPLAARMRPARLDEFVGQQHFLGEGKLLRRLLAADRLSSVIFYGPPGTGKTTLARLLATASRKKFKQLSAITSGVKELRESLDAARDELTSGGLRTLLFIDEIHRFNKTQQDALLPDVEEGVVTLVGATTSNPFFAVNSALVSRSQVFEFQSLSIDDITSLVKRALADKSRGLGNIPVEIDDDALLFLAETSDGDARRALNALEVGVLSSSERPVKFTRELAAESVQRKAIQYDATGDEHYDSISALIKSIRGSDPDAGLYWLARMLEAGEDIRFLCRRLVILASEDVGNADPAALPLAVAAMQACEFIGLPECQLPLAQCVAYLACAPKSNAATIAIGEARRDVREQRILPVPVHLRDKHYKGAERLGHGEGYVYSHDAAGGVVSQDYLGVEREYYRPVDRGFEAELAQRLTEIRARLRDR
ncbi:Replication-associated recombination protein A [Anatilimnocola aggregata]|uniref:Replication-associated recombination protein A n=1 Tax=Anatilimnocola aggregata TaxID=2528021 RepID=A0A517YEH1_9BACT|nr:replication-associated recombination protein A [Anatilimnocola aggregata]QDU28640.1 Replication-associated recombination protein A [Anatilimnocola aggregata]